jgi:hypothetical protein
MGGEIHEGLSGSRGAKDAFRMRLAALSLIFSGISFVAFPAVRPFFDETTLQGAAGFVSIRWVLAHAFGMTGFIFLCLGFLGVWIAIGNGEAEARAFLALVLGWIGTGLTLPFFGAEAFSLQVIARAAVDRNDATLIPLVNEVRFGPGIWFVGVGLVLVAVSTIVLALAIRKSAILPKWGGVPLAVGFTVYLPQLQGGPLFQPIRIAVGLLIALGCGWIAYGLRAVARRAAPSDPSSTDS